MAYWVAQVDAACDGACQVEVGAWVDANGGRPLLPPGAGTRAPAAFRALGLGRLFVVQDPSPAPDGVAWLEPDRRGVALAVPDDPDYDLLWGLGRVGAEAAWDLETGHTVIAVLDSGVSLRQPDLALWTHPTEVPDNGVDDDGNGYVDDVHGWDFAARDPDPSDVSGHGTNVASIAAATGDNGRSLTGVCWGCEVMAVRNLDDDGSGWYSWWTESLVYAVDNGADVVNMSEGGYTTDKALEAAVAYAVAAGVPVIVANGNDGSDRWPNFPALLPDAIAVGATDPDDQRAASFDWGGGSSYGDHLDLVAPGTTIYGLPMLPFASPTYWSGSSQATPFVAGAAALLLSMEPTLSPAEVRAYLEDHAADQVGQPSEDVAGWDRYHGHGRLDVAASVGALAIDIADADGDGIDLRSGDCDDEDPQAWPGAEEIPGDDIDQDCDGVDAEAPDPDPEPPTEATAPTTPPAQEPPDDPRGQEETPAGCGCAGSPPLAATWVPRWVFLLARGRHQG